MTTPKKALTKTVAGIQQKDAARVIPESRRADGTVRKERKVRPGYTPPEDVAKYTNRVLDAARPMEATPAAVATASDHTAKTKTQIKNEKRRAKRKEEGASENTPGSSSSSAEPVKEEGDDGSKSSLPTDHVETTTTATTTTTTTETTAEVTPVDREKKLRGLNKKLKQAEQLKERQDKGEEMLPEQVEKISKMADLQAQIAELSL